MHFVKFQSFGQIIHRFLQSREHPQLLYAVDAIIPKLLRIGFVRRTDSIQPCTAVNTIGRVSGLSAIKGGGEWKRTSAHQSQFVVHDHQDRQQSLLSSRYSSGQGREEDRARV